MCLSYDFTEKHSKIWQQLRKKKWFKVYKLCKKNPYFPRKKGFYPYLWNIIRYKPGLQKANGVEISVDAGWYAFLTRKAALEYSSHGCHCSDPNDKIILICWARGKDIKRYGGYYGCGRAAIFTHLIFPSYPRRTAKKPRIA